MKLIKSILLPCFLFFGLININGQQYIELLGQKNIWSITSCFNGCITDTYFCEEDTTIGGTTYKILDGYHYISGSFLIREDADQQQVYIGIISGNKVNEYLVYDFSLLPGDTVQVYNPISPIPEDIGPLVLDSIRTETLLDGLMHRYYFLKSLQGAYAPVWVEGIGSLCLINAPAATPDINDVAHLSCYSKDYILTYSQTDSIENCDFHIAAGIEKTTKNKFTILPNPVVDHLTIYLEEIQLKEIVISGLDGKPIWRTNKEILSIDVSQFKSGVYVISVLDQQEHLWSSKFIKL